MALSLESLLARRRAKKTNISHATNSNVTVSDNLNTSLNNNTQASAISKIGNGEWRTGNGESLK